MALASSTPKDLSEALSMPPPLPPAEAGTSGTSGAKKQTDQDTVDGVTRQDIISTCNYSSTLRELPLISRHTILTSMLEGFKKSEAQKFASSGFNDAHLELLKSIHSLGYVVVSRTENVISLCCPYGQVSVLSREAFENTKELQVMWNDFHVVKVWVKDYQDTPQQLNQVDPDTVFTYLETTLEEIEFCPKKQSDKEFRLSDNTELIDLMKGVAYAIAFKATKFTREDNANLTPQIRAEVLAMKERRIHPREDSESKGSWQSLARSLMLDGYYTHVRNLYFDEIRDKLKLTQLASTELWLRKSFPDSLGLGRKIHYTSQIFCRICALPKNQHNGKVHDEAEVAFRRCFYPLCTEDEDHSVATCNAILEVCEVCKRRGHNESHHDHHTFVELEAIFLNFCDYNFKASLLTVIQDKSKKVSNKLVIEAWRTSFYLGKYSGKMAAVLGFEKPQFEQPQRKVEKRKREIEPGSKADYFRIASKVHRKATKVAKKLHWQNVVSSEKYGKDARSKISSRSRLASLNTSVSGSSLPFQSPRLSVLNQPRVDTDDKSSTSQAQTPSAVMDSSPADLIDLHTVIDVSSTPVETTPVSKEVVEVPSVKASTTVPAEASDSSRAADKSMEVDSEDYLDSAAILFGEDHANI